VIHLTIAFGLLLILLGVGGYFGSKRVSKTALIPAYFGAPILVLGLVARVKIKWAHAALWMAAVLAVLGFLGSARGLPGLLRMLRGETVQRRAAVIAQSVMAALCAAYALVVIWSLLATS
jgi:hypothetical protein